MWSWAGSESEFFYVDGEGVDVKELKIFIESLMGTVRQDTAREIIGLLRNDIVDENTLSASDEVIARMIITKKYLDSKGND